jgi:CRP-like cAMP-binding protein
MLTSNRLDQSLVQNRILAQMSADAYAALAPDLERVQLKRRAIVQERHWPLEYVYFLERGVASIFAWTRQDGPVQVAIVGRYGLVGVGAVLGITRSPHRCQMQTDGEALRIPVRALNAAMEASSATRRPLLNYVHFLLIQNSQFALCNARHELEQRVSRCLLSTHDRLDGDIIPVTHDLLSMMLGVRRAGITEVLGVLEEAGAVRRARGAIEIVDRTLLEARACECYRIIAAERMRSAGQEIRHAAVG